MSRIATAASYLAARFAALYHAGYDAVTAELAASAQATDLGHHALLDAMRAYYHSNALYDILGASAETERLRSIRNPVASFVGFYLDLLWPTRLHVVTDDARMGEALDALRRWSNWQAQREKAAFHLALYGEMFLKTAVTADGARVFHQAIDPRHVRSLERDERGFLVWLHVAHPITVRDPQTGRAVEAYHAETWEPGRYRRWHLDRVPAEPDDLERLGAPADTRESGVGPEALPVDFVPVAYARFQETGGARGLPPVLVALEDVDEANRIATRLHALLRAYRADKQLVGEALDKAGRPLPPPNFEERSDALGRVTKSDAGEVLVGGENVFKLPSGWRLESLIPPLDFGALLEVVAAQAEQVARKLPEIRYYDTQTFAGEESGRAIRYRLTPALNRAARVRAQAERALVVADMHALTIGNRVGAWEIGTEEDWRAGRLEHAFAPEEMIPLSRAERADAMKTLTDAGASLGGAARYMGVTEEEADVLARSDTIPPEM